MINSVLESSIAINFHLTKKNPSKIYKNDCSLKGVMISEEELEELQVLADIYKPFFFSILFSEHDTINLVSNFNEKSGDLVNIHLKKLKSDNSSKNSQQNMFREELDRYVNLPYGMTVKDSLLCRELIALSVLDYKISNVRDVCHGSFGS